jgi:hypothetical protein
VLQGGKGTHASQNPETPVQLQFKYWRFLSEIWHLNCCSAAFGSPYVHDFLKKSLSHAKMENGSVLLHYFLHFLFILRTLGRIVRHKSMLTGVTSLTDRLKRRSSPGSGNRLTDVTGGTHE